MGPHTLCVSTQNNLLYSENSTWATRPLQPLHLRIHATKLDYFLGDRQACVWPKCNS